MRCAFLIAAIGFSWNARAQAFVSATSALEQDRKDATASFYSGLAYWVAGGALLGAGVATLAVTHPLGDTPADRLGLVSGTATLVSGLSSCFSAWPRTLESSVLERTVAAHGGESLDEAHARQVVQAHAVWSRRWRLRTLVVTTALLAVNALGAYALRFSYERVETAVVAGLYGIGVPIVLWYDSAPWSEETALDQMPAPSPAVALRVSPGTTVGVSGPSFSVALGLTW